MQAAQDKESEHGVQDTPIRGWRRFYADAECPGRQGQEHQARNGRERHPIHNAEGRPASGPQRTEVDREHHHRFTQERHDYHENDKEQLN